MLQNQKNLSKILLGLGLWDKENSLGEIEKSVYTNRGERSGY